MLTSVLFLRRNPALRPPPPSLLLPSHPFSTYRRHRSRDYYNPHHHRHPRTPKSPPPPTPAALHSLISSLPPRLSPEDLTVLISSQPNPHLCLHLLRHALRLPRFRPQPSSFLLTIKKLGSASLHQDLASAASLALSHPEALDLDLLNTIIYFLTQARLLSKAINVYKFMRDYPSPFAAAIRPNLATYNLLFAALLSRDGNSFINHMYMDNVRALFRQMVDSGIEPDVLAVNALIKGYVLSLHVNDALRVLHEMGGGEGGGGIYKCSPNEASYSYVVHGLCAQGRTRNARELVEEMKAKGFVLGEKAYNSLACALALAGEVDVAVSILKEMEGCRRRTDIVTYRTVLGEVCRAGKCEAAVELLREWRRKKIVGESGYWDLLDGLREEFGEIFGRGRG